MIPFGSGGHDMCKLVCGHVFYLTGAVKKSAVGQAMVISVDLGTSECNVDAQYVSNQAFTEVLCLVSYKQLVTSWWDVLANVTPLKTSWYRILLTCLRSYVTTDWNWESKLEIFLRSVIWIHRCSPRLSLQSGGEEHGSKGKQLIWNLTFNWSCVNDRNGLWLFSQSVLLQ
jgi:hypothetical protein